MPGAPLSMRGGSINGRKRGLACNDCGQPETTLRGGALQRARLCALLGANGGGAPALDNATSNSRVSFGVV